MMHPLSMFTCHLPEGPPDGLGLPLELAGALTEPVKAQQPHHATSALEDGGGASRDSSRGRHRRKRLEGRSVW